MPCRVRAWRKLTWRAQVCPVGSSRASRPGVSQGIFWELPEHRLCRRESQQIRGGGDRVAEELWS